MNYWIEKSRNALRDKHGFTLIEMIITVAIISILTGLTALGVHGWLSSAYTARVNETARTVFYAAQNYLLEQKQMGKLDAFVVESAAFGGEISWDTLKEILSKNTPDFDPDDYESKYAVDSSVYLLMEKGSSVSNPLYRIVQEATQDIGLLEHTFLLEYDKKTGVVRSVFYSEDSASFSYSGDAGAKSNVIIRSTEALQQKKQGYYGVSITGKKAVSQIYMSEPKDTLLFNGERLYLQWTDTNNENPEFDIRPELLQSIMFDVSVYRQEGTGSEKLFTIEGISVADQTADIALNQADDALTAPHGYRVAYQKESRTYQIILDDIHHSIFQTYVSGAALPSNVTVFQDVKAEDILFCEVTARLNPVETGLEAESLAAYSNYQSSAFGGGNRDWAGSSGMVNTMGSGVLEKGTEGIPYSLFCSRHLENMRYGSNVEENSNFVQTKDIDWKRAEGRNFSKAFEPLSVSAPFRGSYVAATKSADSYYAISNLSIQTNAAKPSGMFSQNMGRIQGLTLLNPTVSGLVCTGTVAGVNGGIIEDVSVKGGVVKSSHLAGGITGYNTASGQLKNLVAETEMEGKTILPQKMSVENIEVFDAGTKGKYVGGIAGINRGQGEMLTAGKKGSSKITGTAYVGGIFGSNETPDTTTIIDLVNYSRIILDSQAGAAEALECFGGLVGYQAGGRLFRGKNYGLLAMDTIAGMAGNRLVNLGGIAGDNKGKLEDCINYAGEGTDTLVSKKVTDLQKDCVDKIIRNSFPAYMGKYVGGIAGTNRSEGEIVNCINRNSAVLGFSVVGGLVGNNQGSVRCNAASASSGLIIASDYLAGGIFGFNAGSEVSGYTNQANIFARGMTGGIMGFHGSLPDNREDSVLNYLHSIGVESTPGYYEKLLNPEGILQAGSAKRITNCLNKGFVFALDFYAGGIVGANFGTIDSSNTEVSNMSLFEDLHEKGNADCVGGITGFNGSTGKIDGTQVFKQKAAVELVADDFLGGIAGYNCGTVAGYLAVEGNIYGKGECVGGVIGLNSNEAAVSELTSNKTDHITGSYFVGGIIGCNVAPAGNRNTVISGVHSEKGEISGTAYVGGILGYNAYVDAGTSMAGLFLPGGELKRLREDAFLAKPGSEGTEGSQVTVFKGCNNKAAVKADRFIGGIVGYNSSRAQLWIARCTNTGTISIQNPEKTGTTPEGEIYYYIGGITGRNSKSGIIHNCINDGAVQSFSTYLGGICEVNEGYVQFCATGTTSAGGTDNVEGKGNNSVGGIVGLNASTGKVVSCRADQYAKIRGGNRTGGLVGTNAANGVITSNWNGTEARDVTAIGETAVSSGENSMSYCSAYLIGANDTGGIVGSNQGSVEHIRVTSQARITGKTNVGGFVGNNLKGASLGVSGDVIANLTNYASVYGDHEVGGIVGKHNGSGIRNCTNAGTVEAIGIDTGNAGGITGSSVRGVLIENCTNYGTVRSNSSFAGGITGINNGTLRSCNNFGSVEGSTASRGVNVNGDNATGSAIGGITGCNLVSGFVYDCASRNRKDDPEGKEKNPFWNDKTENKIRGNYIVGGIIGHYARHQFGDGEFRNTTPLSTNVSITIEPQDVSIGNNIRCKIGGFIGEYTPNPREEVLENYTFSGKIAVSAKAGKNQQNIGGIVSWQHPKITLKNCFFSGSITGEGNNGDTNGNYAGVGGLAGRSEGTIIVLPDKNGSYVSNTEGSVVQGAKRVGGVVGETWDTFQMVLQVEGREINLEDVNNGKTPDQYLYYENRAQVTGSKAVGGVYGSVNASSSQNLVYLKNNGNIYTTGVNGNTSIGGITGETSVTRIMDYCINNALIGDEKDSQVTENVGGLIGQWTNSGYKTMSNCRNTEAALIFAGKKSVGGLVGYLKEGTIQSNCSNNGAIIVNNKGISAAVQAVGGLAGTADNVKIAPDATAPVEMNSSMNVIALRGKATYVGGIIGQTTGDLTVSNVKNMFSITSSGSSNRNQEVRVGGIVGGRTGGTLVLSGCENTGVMVMGDSIAVGGILGTFVNSGTMSMTECKNSGSITGSADVGGIAGSILGGTVTDMRDNLNTASIKGRKQVGGLAGRISGATVKMQNSGNSGTVTAVKDAAGARDVIMIGGCVGYADGTVALSALKNTGKVTAEESTANNITTIMNIGGIVGSMNGASASLNSCLNEGEIRVRAASGYQCYGVGGISGALRGGAKVGMNDNKLSRTINRGALSITGTTVQEVGGIAGFEGEKSIIQYASNEADVLGSTDTTNEIGGIVGKTYGMVYSCRTGDGVTVTGNSSVGGLVGRAYDYSTKITSIGTGVAGATGYELSVNNADVKGNQKIGGIIGWQQEATIYNVYVSGKAEITLLKKGGTDNAAGGLVGYSGAMDGGLAAKGILASCYSNASVKGIGSADGSPYIGGIIGYREHTGNGAASSITDCFAVRKDEVEQTVPPGEKGGNVALASWSVGNEPYETVGHTGYIFREDRDSQAYEAVNPLDTADKFFWSEDSYRALYAALIGGVPGDYRDESAILDIMQHYDGFKLPAPEMSQVNAAEGFSYTFPFRPLAGFYTKYGMKFYEGAYPLGKEVPAGAKLLDDKSRTIAIGDKMQSMTVSLQNGFRGVPISEYVGKTITVVTYAEGYALNDVGQYTKRSDEIAMQQFVIMPPLPAPQVKALEPQTTDTDWFDASGKQVKVRLEITNWPEYKKAAQSLYPYLSHLDPALIAETDLYTEFLNGVLRFEMTDSLNTQKGAGIGNTKIIHSITEKSMAAAGMPYYEVVADPVSGAEKAYITIDYTSHPVFEANFADRPWHAFRIRAVQAYSTPLDPLNRSFRYRYLNSTEYTGADYRLKSQLFKPIQLNAVYMGGTSPETEPKTPEYELQWKLGGGNAGDVGGWKVELQYFKISKMDGTEEIIPFQDAAYQTEPYVKLVRDAANARAALTRAELETIVAACGIDTSVLPWWGHEEKYSIGYTVTALSRDTAVNLDSIRSDLYEFSLIKREKPVQDIAVARTENRLSISWSDQTYDSINPENNQYVVSYEILANGNPLETNTVLVQEECRLDGINIRTELVDAPFTVRMSIMKKGTIGKTLDSVPEVKDQLIGKKLEMPHSIGLSALRMETADDGNKNMTLRMAWDNSGTATGQTEITESNCSGYEVEVVLTRNGQQEEPIKLPVAGWDQKQLEFEVPYEGVTEIKVNVKAVGIYPKAESSEWGYRTISMAAKIPEAPKINEITLNGQAVYPITPQPAYTRKDYHDLQFAYAVNTDYADGQQFTVADSVSGNILFEMETNTTVGDNLPMILPAEQFHLGRAGEMMKIRMSNMSADLSKQLPSAVAETVFTMPRIMLVQPVITAVSTKEVSDEGDTFTIFTAEVDAYGTIADEVSDTITEESIRLEEDAVRTGQRYRLRKLETNGDITEWKEATFIPVDENGLPLNDGTPVTSYETMDPPGLTAFSFRMESEAGTDELAEYSLEVVNLSLKDSSNLKFADSAAANSLLDGSQIINTIDMPEGSEELPLPEEETETGTEEETTDTTESGTTENSTTESSTTETSVTETGTSASVEISSETVAGSRPEGSTSPEIQTSVSTNVQPETKASYDIGG